MSHHKHDENHGGKFKAFFVGSVLGGIIGSMTALLYAPKEGKKMRKDINKKCKNLSHKTEAMCHDAYDKCLDMMDNMKEFAEKTKKKIRHK